jgi:hypothetical protein
MQDLVGLKIDESESALMSETISTVQMLDFKMTRADCGF